MEPPLGFEPRPSAYKAVMLAINTTGAGGAPYEIRTRVFR